MPITTPFVRKSTQIYGDLRRFWEKAKIKESAKKPGITGFYRLMKGYIQDDKNTFYLPRQYLEKSRKSL